MKNIKTLLIILTLFLGYLSSAQDSRRDCFSQYNTLADREVYLYTDKIPEFPGGKDCMYDFIKNNIQYPIHVACFKGKVYVSFIVEKNGELTTLSIKKGVDQIVDNKVISLIEKIPNWIPGSCKGEIVPFEIILPISFL